MQNHLQNHKILDNIEFIHTIHKVYPTHTKIIKYKKPYKKPNQTNRIKRPKKNKPDIFLQAIQRTKTAITDYSLCNDFQYFVTLTLDPKKIDRYDYNKIVPKITYFLRRNLTKYLLVPEKHKDGAFHFHLLANIPTTQLSHTFANNYTLSTYNLGYSNARPITQSETDRQRISYYIQKYITKDLIKTVPNGRKRYWVSKNLQQPIKTYNTPVPYESIKVYETDEYIIYHELLAENTPLNYNESIN